MAQYKFIEPTELSLNQIAQPVDVLEFGTNELNDVVNSMKRIAIGERSEEHPELPSMVGLAAPQIGVGKRIILLDFNALSTKVNFDIDLRIVINPILTNASTEEELGREGCYSTGRIAGAVYRSKHICLLGLNENGEEVSYNLEGFLASIAQHETDHLNGVRFPDRVRSPKHLHHVPLEEFQDYREHWATWTQFYPFEKWLDMKNGKES